MSLVHIVSVLLLHDKIGPAICKSVRAPMTLLPIEICPPTLVHKLPLTLSAMRVSFESGQSRDESAGMYEDRVKSPRSLIYRLRHPSASKFLRRVHFAISESR
jgi:hypothetical protein